MAAKHTPTPWTVSQVNACAIAAPAKHGYVAEVFAIDNSQYKQQSAEANAAFIVLAVNAHDDLVKALQTMLAFDSYETEYDGRTYLICPSCGAQDNREHRASCDFVFARAALAKAGAA